MKIRSLRSARLIGLAIVIVAFAMAFMAGPGWATRIHSKTSIPAIMFNDSATHRILGKRFRLLKRGRVAIFYTAECAVDGDTTLDRVELDILVDGTVVPVTDDLNFCSSDVTGALTGFASHSMNVVVVLDPGRHVVRITARGVEIGAADLWSVAKQSLTIIVERN